LPDFCPFPGMDGMEQMYASDALFPLFANRLLSPSRPEYEEFLKWGGFNPSDSPPPLAILGVTEGIRQTDSIEVFPCPRPDVNGCYDSRFFLHGIRWMPQAAVDRIAQLGAGDRLLLMPDLQNESDRNAIAVRTEVERTLIGYVPRYLARDVRTLLEQCTDVELVVEQINWDAPFQQRLLCSLRSCWPDSFHPCSGEEFHPIPVNAPELCDAMW
jgi:hypothetical protein